MGIIPHGFPLVIVRLEDTLTKPPAGLHRLLRWISLIILLIRSHGRWGTAQLAEKTFVLGHTSVLVESIATS